MDVLTHLFVEFKDEPGRFDRVLTEIVEVVGGSFIADAKPGAPSKDEIKRRTEICAKWLMTFRRDLHWSVTRALDELPKALRSELDGIAYTPTREGQRSWSAENGRDLIWMPPR